MAVCRQRLFHQSMYSNSAYSACSMVRQGPQRWMSSVLICPMAHSVRALS